MLQMMPADGWMAGWTDKEKDGTPPATTCVPLFAWAIVRAMNGKKASTQVPGLFMDTHSIAFSGRTCHRSSKASRGEDLEIEQPVSCWDCSSFDFHSTVASMLGAALIRDGVVQMGQPSQKRLLVT